MKIPVYITTIAQKHIGEVDIDSPDEFESAAYDLWDSIGNKYPTLCHQCSSECELNDWDIDSDDIAEDYFTPLKEK